MAQTKGETKGASMASIFETRIECGCRELTAGNWFSPRGAVGTQRDQSLISEDFGESCQRFQRLRLKPTPTTSSLSSSTGPLRASLLFRPRWRRRRCDTQPNRRLARKKRELQELLKRAMPRCRRAQSDFFFPPPPRPPPYFGDSPWPATPGLKAPASLPTGVNCIPFRKNCWSPQPKVPAAISVEK